MRLGGMVLDIMAAARDDDTDPRQQRGDRNKHPGRQRESPTVGVSQGHGGQRRNRGADLQHREIRSAHQRDAMREVPLDQWRDHDVADAHAEQSQAGQHQQTAG